jgi:hypothetical protein
MHGNRLVLIHIAVCGRPATSQCAGDPFSAYHAAVSMEAPLPQLADKSAGPFGRHTPRRLVPDRTGGVRFPGRGQ